MQRSSEVPRPQIFDAVSQIKKVENPNDQISQAKYDFLYVVTQRLEALAGNPTVNLIAGELNLLKMGVTQRKGRAETEEYSQYFAHYFHDTSLIHIADKDVNPYTLESYKASGMCASVKGYAVWFAEDHGKPCLYFGKEPM